MKTPRFVYSDVPFKIPMLSPFAGWTPGPLSFIRRDHRNEEWLHVHEAVHQRQFWRNPFVYIFGYLFSGWIRMDLEAEAFAEELEFMGREYDDEAIDAKALTICRLYRTGYPYADCRRRIQHHLDAIAQQQTRV